MTAEELRVHRELEALRAAGKLRPKRRGKGESAAVKRARRARIRERYAKLEEVRS